MKVLFFLPAAFLLSVAQADTDVWYDATGKEIAKTPVYTEKEAFVPEWKKRELARLEAQRTGSFNRGSRFFRSGRSFGFGSRFRTSGFRSFRGGSRFSSSRFRGTSFRGSRGSFRGGGSRGFVKVKF